MKRLILVRHAKAVKGYPDYERPLSDVGTTDAHETAEALKPFVPDNKHIVASPSRRTRQTAAILFPDADVLWHEGLYLAPPEYIKNLIQTRFNDRSTVAVVGHNDGLTDIAVRLCEHRFTDHLPTSGFCVLDFATFKENAGKLVHFHVPKRILRDD